MNDRPAWPGAKVRVEPHRFLEEMPGQFVFRSGELIHVPETAMIGLPGVQGVGRLQDRSVSLRRLDFGRNRGDDAIGDVAEDFECFLLPAVEHLGPRNSRRLDFDQFDRDQDAAALAAHGSDGDVVDVQSSPGVLGPDAAFREGEDRAPRDHEQAPQFG